jgi:hypothetical protein
MQRIEQSTFERLLISYARRFPFQQGELRAVDELWRVAAGNRGVRRMADLKYGSFKMPCDLDEILQRHYYFFGTYFWGNTFSSLADRGKRCQGHP